MTSFKQTLVDIDRLYNCKPGNTSMNGLVYKM